ncbi:hypothetical protein HGA64_00880 [Candidatus Falkowbacteria bacterium]|nr:hypothetical protein [Candidatus Falkowbacteria bacterium]
MKNELQILSKQVKKEADLLLKKTKLIELLNKYGYVHKRGSYELDLMVDGDIDVYVIDKQFSKERAMQCLNELILQNAFRGYLFYDFVKRRKRGFPKGYYLGLKTLFNGKKWNIDIWFMKSMDGVSNRFMKKVVAGLNDVRREKILELKKIVKDRKIDLPSFVIYNAVIDGGVVDIKQLSAFAIKEGYQIS